jgi:hypothetical protein
MHPKSKGINKGRGREMAFASIGDLYFFLIPKNQNSGFLRITTNFWQKALTKRTAISKSNQSMHNT